MGIAMLRAPFAIAAEIRAAFARRVGAERNVTVVVGNGEN